MKLLPSIARRLVIGGVLASFVAAAAPTALHQSRYVPDRPETALARLDPAAVLGGADGLMPEHERERPERWEDRRSRRRRDSRRGAERRERDADRAVDPS